MTSYNVIEGPDIDEESVQGQDQDNEVEIMDGEYHIIFFFYAELEVGVKLFMNDLSLF